MKIELKHGKTKFHSTNYSASEKNFQILGNNRGKGENGYDPKRVQGIMTLIISSIFVWLLSTIKVIYRKKTKSLVVLDGANRVTAVRFLIEKGVLPLNYPIPFTVVNDGKLEKMSNRDLIDFISVVNEYDPRWKESEHYKAALSSKLKTASMFEIFLTKFKNEAKRLVYQKDWRNRTIGLKLNVLLSLATKTPIVNGVSTVKYKDFKNDDIGNHMVTPEFNEDFNALIDYLEIAKHWHGDNNIRVSRSIFHVLSIVYNETVKVSFPYLVSKLKETNKRPSGESTLRSFLTNIAFS